MKLLSLLLAASLTFIQATEQQVWDAANALRSKAAYPEAAAAFEAFPAQFPQSTRATQALIEAGVCWFSGARSAQVMRRNTPEAEARFAKGLALFDRVIAEHPKEPIASRAAHMRGSTFLFSGRLAEAELAYSRVLEELAFDPSYVEKALEYRANTRRHLLKTGLALADFERFLREFPKSQRADSLKKTLEIARTLDKPAPPYAPEQWISGDPTPLELQSGHVVALYFWATWCTNCAKEQPFLLDLVKRYTPKGVVFVGVTDHQQGQSADQVKKHVAQHGYTFPVFQDAGATSLAYKVASIPHLVLIDREGKVRWSDNPANLCEATLDAILAAEPHGK
ncbi:MAG: redoxin family protein [Planctomycetes bacterium]|nr:redoxin family protein [Planctomycetota bacterium]